MFGQQMFGWTYHLQYNDLYQKKLMKKKIVIRSPLDKIRNVKRFFLHNANSSAIWSELKVWYETKLVIWIKIPDFVVRIMRIISAIWIKKRYLKRTFRTEPNFYRYMKLIFRNWSEILHLNKKKSIWSIF